MNKKYTYIGGIIVAILLLIGGYFLYENENKKEELELVREEQKSSAEIKSVYKELYIGNNIDNIEKKLGNPLFTESSSDSNGNATTVYTWGSNELGEIGSKLVVNVENNKIIEKSVSGLYVPYEKKYLISSNLFEKININNNYSIEDASKQFGDPNKISEYKNNKGETIQIMTWETNTTGPVGSYCTIIFTNNIATSKNEVGLI
ncbi:hypothetical protein IGJ91_002990 [Enterococcus sp. DIV0765f]|uniref:DUF3862 domain-containing protein n=1 Tax=Enterococcus sp. DIV0765f TaxID=2774783 RepID=UPI003F21936F